MSASRRRLIDSYPEQQRAQVREQLKENRSVVAQMAAPPDERKAVKKNLPLRQVDKPDLVVRRCNTKRPMKTSGDGSSRRFAGRYCKG